ncbi:hypothetical protein [Caviibacterium pharyngocola]|uniref:Uncharacterized protein n=1 Tax=Caviibacterium pharyngocola TaxID=28159 RepID=A0A2M8RTH9_9PAST|nr:hypothetical protein [Caviibacterium pharyngocola]PJG82203.1 hypothetical protein CVP04_10500 [Caviibacterium pharyngocola]
MEYIIEEINNLGWLSTLSGIVGLGVMLLALIKKPRIWICNKVRRVRTTIKYHSIYEFIQENGLDKKSFLNPKDLRILILDDEPQNYPIDYLKESKYDIESITKISLSKMDTISKYHIIILDITGIVEEDLKQGGFELLKRLRTSKPVGQAIIAASSKRFDISVADFYKLADLKIKTPIEPIEIEDILIEAAKLKFNTIDLAQQLDSILYKIPRSDIRKNITSNIILFLDKEISFETLKKKISSYDYEKKEELLNIVESLNHQVNHEKNN